MKIEGKIHCMFEQSGTFKEEFRKLGYEAFDYDIQNDFGQTDYVMDLFKEIENGYENKASLFDKISQNDLVLAFFPCIYFCAASQMAMSFTFKNYRRMSIRQKTDYILKRSRNREKFFRLLVSLVSLCYQRKIRLIVENPWSEQTFLKANFVMPPTMIDTDRTRRGDNYKKPTAYFFVNCEPTCVHSYQKPQGGVKTILKSRKGKQTGICSEERSMISHDYARNFICDFILGKPQKGITELNLFD